MPERPARVAAGYWNPRDFPISNVTLMDEQEEGHVDEVVPNAGQTVWHFRPTYARVIHEFW